MSDKLTVEDLKTIRHEVAHTVAGYLVLGAGSVRRVTRVPNGNEIGCASFDVPEFTDPALIPMAAMDYAVVLSIPQLIPTAAKGHGRDKERVFECQSIAYRYASKVADVGEWREGWDYRMWKRVEELLESRMFWKGVNALELRLDTWPTLSGEVVRAILAKVYAGASTACVARQPLDHDPEAIAGSRIAEVPAVGVAFALSRS